MMKMRAISLIFLLAFGIPLGAQSIRTTVDALVRGDREYFNKNFTPEVSLTIEDQEQVVSKPEAIQKIMDFVQSMSIRSGKTIHEGVSKGKDSSMGIGSLLADKSKYRVYVSFKTVEGAKLIHELRFEKDIL